LKVCDLTQFYSPVSGGVKRYLEQKVAYLRKHAPDNRHVLIVPGERTEMTEDGLSRVYSIRGPLVSRTSRYRMLLDLAAIEEILEREKPDLIESGDPYQVAWKAVVSGRLLGIPAVGFYHSHFPEAYIRSVAKFFGKIALHVTQEVAERYVRSLYNRFERTLVPSPALAALLQDWGIENVQNIDLGVDTEVFQPDAEDGVRQRSQLGIPEDRILLLYIGRLAPEKNIRTLLEAFQFLHTQSPGKFHLLAIGDGSLRSALRRVDEKTGAVSRLSYCSNARQLASWYRAADLFVHPSVNETFGLVTLESQACGTPVVGISGSYMDRIIFSDQSHWAPANTPTALAGAIREMASQDLQKAGLTAAEEVRSRYSWDRVFGQLFGIYRQVIAEYTP